jgi:hypothetical protein
MKLVVPANPFENQWMCDWAARRIGQDAFERAQAIGWADKHGIVAIVVLHDLSPPNVMLSWASSSPRWMTRKALWTVFNWAFNQLKVDRITGLVERPNKHARRLNEKLGMKLEGVLRKASPHGKDIFVFGMLREEAEALMKRLKAHG